MTASELIDLLKSHPKACRALNVKHTMQRPKTDDTDVWCDDGLSLDADFGDEAFDSFRRWLLGAAQEYADEQGWNVEHVQLLGGKSECTVSDGLEDEMVVLAARPTRLHALLAGIEEVANAR